MTDRKIGTFLSGGLDSSLITALVNRYNPYTVNTYSVGMGGATDFKFAAKVAEHLQTNHHEVVFTADEGMLYMLRHGLSDLIHDPSERDMDRDRGVGTSHLCAGDV